MFRQAIFKHMVVGMAFGLSLLLPSWAASIVGQTYPDTVELGGKVLVLNGMGTRSVINITGYSAGLYMVQKSDTPEGVVAMEGPKRLDLRMVMDIVNKVAPAEFTKAIQKGFLRHQTPEQYEVLKARMTRFNQAVEDLGTIRRGDVMVLDYLPGKGTQLFVNGIARSEHIAGDDFFDALMLCFIGNQVRDQKLKAGLLGRKV